MFSSGGPSVRFLTRYDGEVSEPLVGRQGSRVSMRVAGGSASLLPSHGRGIWPRDVLKKVSRGLSRVEAGNPGVPRLVQVTSASTALYDSGVSLQLAQQRKESIKELAYSLYFSIPKEKNSPVEGVAEISFSVDKLQEIIVDYRETERIKEVTVNGKATAYTLKNEHIIIPQGAVERGKNSIRVAFTAADQSLNRNEEFLYTLLVPDRARTLFPCFDQPDLKAIFTLTLELPAQWTAVVS